MIYSVLRPLLFRLDAERAHVMTVQALARTPLAPPKPFPPQLAITLAGLDFPAPVGLAAGFDKDAHAAHKMHGLGFGFCEVGTITPKPQPGNPKPRVFRLVEDQGVINAMGFNSGGQQAAAMRLARQTRYGIVGINVGANKESPDRIADYAQGVRTMAPLADYLTLNISSPNTPGLRALQDPGALDALLGAVVEARGENKVPLFLKLAPDLQPADIEDIVRLATQHRIDALMLFNTTNERPSTLRSKLAQETGGLSGAPFTAMALSQLKAFRRVAGTSIPLIGVGGIASAEDAYARIRAGASLVQLYSALVYHGPTLPAKINAGLVKLLARDGFKTLSEAVGIDE